MKTAILTTQSKGQIMLPKEWRDDLNTQVFQAVREGDMIVLVPVDTFTEEEVKKASKKFIEKNKKLLKELSKR